MMSCSSLSLAASTEPAPAPAAAPAPAPGAASFLSPVRRSRTSGRICWKHASRARCGFQFCNKRERFGDREDMGQYLVVLVIC